MTVSERNTLNVAYALVTHAESDVRVPPTIRRDLRIVIRDLKELLEGPIQRESSLNCHKGSAHLAHYEERDGKGE